jgi:hypothetical protein
VQAALALEKLPLAQQVAGVLERDVAASPFLLLYPELRTATAPRWLRAGMRVTYQAAYATLSQPPAVRQMPDVTPPPMPAGAGLIQYDVIAKDRSQVVVQATLINTQIQGQPPSPLSHAVGLPGVGEIWFAPQALANAESAAGPAFEVARLPLEVEGVAYEVVRMRSVTEGGEEVWAFEVASGLLVFYRQALYWPDGTQRSGITMSLLGRRQVRLPWRRGSVPAWVEPGLVGRLAGSQGFDLGFGPYTPLPLELHTRVTRVESLWSEHAQTVSMQGQTIGSSVGATGVAQLFGGLWLPPEALETLEAGNVLDQDPITEVETRVEQAGPRQIVLVAAGPGHLTRLTYDAQNGRLIALYQEQQSLNGTLYTEVESVR